ncbi:MAG TPA: maleylpyruvate isomerase N-terminal domain-containing protein [Chloroflexia bacterium]|nr:maleylpyruvate isomerase N-terminal domain-containing protein [Chloroflexia bacterium]
MDSEKTGRLRSGLDDALSNLMAVLPGADNEPGWAIATGDEDWTVRQTLAHLASAESSMIALIERAFAAAQAGQSIGALLSRGSDGQPFDVHVWNRRQVEKRAQQPPSALRLELTEARAQTLRALKPLSPDQLATPAWHPALGDTTVEGIFKLMAIHMRAHTSAIKKALRAGIQGRYWADVE